MSEKSNQIETMSDPSGYFKPGERKAIYNECESLRDKVLIRLLWKSGRRVGEVLQLKVKDINFAEKNILWHIEKKFKKTPDGTKKIDLRRIKPMDEFTLKLLAHYIMENYLHAEDYIIYGYDKFKPISRQRVDEIIKDRAGKAGIFYVGESKPHAHHFRHTLSVNWMKNATSPADLRKLQTFLEHSNITTTEAYMQFATEETREIIEMDED